MNVSLVDTSAVSTTAARPGGSSRLMRPEQTVSSTEWLRGVELETKFSQSYAHGKIMFMIFVFKIVNATKHSMSMCFGFVWH